MATNSFGDIFRYTTWGESHGHSIGVVIDGCPSGLHLSEIDLTDALSFRRPGYRHGASARKEPDIAHIKSGVFNGITTGAPISVQVDNCDVQSNDYSQLQNIDRPGHAEYTYRKKYGSFDYRGGGRSSARETVCRVIAGVIAQKVLDLYDIECLASVASIGDIIIAQNIPNDIAQNAIYADSYYCSTPEQSSLVKQIITNLQKEGDSIGGAVLFAIRGVPAGLGDPIYKKLDAVLAYGMMSIPASKAFEIGRGVDVGLLKGSENNDVYHYEKGVVEPETNNSGGLLGGISTGLPIYGRVTFKPASSINKPQDTVDTDGKPVSFKVQGGHRHDPTVVIRAVPVVRAMCQVAMADAVLLKQAYSKF